MKNFIITALLTVCTTSAFASYPEYRLWIAEQEIQPLTMNKVKLETKLGAPSIRKPNTFIWNIGNGTITANFKGDALDSIYVTGNWNGLPNSDTAKAAISNGKNTIANYYSGALGYVSDFVDHGCQYSEVIDKDAQIVRYGIKVQGPKNTSMIYGRDMERTNSFVIYRANLFGWKNEPVEKKTQRCFKGPKAR